MAYKIIFTDSYTKRAEKFIKKHPELLTLYRKTLLLLELNPQHNSLRLHRLEGRLSDLYSVSINMQYRITLELIIDGETVIPVNIGTHDEVYRR